MPLLLQRAQATWRQQLEEALRESHWDGRALFDRISWLIDTISEAHVHQRRILAAFIAGRFTATVQMSPESLEHAQATMTAMRRLLLGRRDEICHPEPDTAVRVGLYMCLQSLQTAFLFESLPSDMTEQTIVNEAKRMLYRYLTGTGTTD